MSSPAVVCRSERAFVSLVFELRERLTVGGIDASSAPVRLTGDGRWVEAKAFEFVAPGRHSAHVALDVGMAVIVAG